MAFCRVLVWSALHCGKVYAVNTAVDSRDADNILRWDGEKRGHYEVYFLKFNDSLNRMACWIRYTLTSPTEGCGDAYCELWGIFFDVDNPRNNFAVKKRYPVGALGWERDRFQLSIGDAELLPGSCHGSIESAGGEHSLAWGLDFESRSPTLYHFPYQSMYRLAFPKTKVLCPYVDARFSGWLEADGKRFKLERVPGQQEHLWGTKHALRWAWGHCNSFAEDPGAVWEGLDAQIKMGPVPSPHLKVFYLKAFGREHHFSALPRWFLNRSRWELGKWSFEARNAQVRVRGEISCRPEEMVAVTYTDPDGELLWCNNSKVARMELEILDHSGASLGTLTTADTAAAEFVDRRTYPQVPIRL